MTEKNDVKRLFNLKEEKKILERSLNLYYFDREKRAKLFEKLEKIIIEIERVENNGNSKNRNTNTASYKKKSF